MGMFDRFFFEDGILPDNKVSEGYEFQTKSLDCMLDTYRVDSEGNVIKNRDDEDLEGPINECAYVYSHEFPYEDADGNVVYQRKTFKEKRLETRFQEYKVLIANSKVVHVEKVSEQGYSQDEEI